MSKPEDKKLITGNWEEQKLHKQPTQTDVKPPKSPDGKPQSKKENKKVDDDEEAPEPKLFDPKDILHSWKEEKKGQSPRDDDNRGF